MGLKGLLGGRAGVSMHGFGEKEIIFCGLVVSVFSVDVVRDILLISIS